jgi:succinate dehydrogenase/fumarate reductase flavoprotein subunit
MEEQKRTTRREFLRGATVVGAGMVATGALASCTMVTLTPAPEIPTPVPETWDKETDVVVVGSGGAGFAAALEAVDNGADVIMLEKLPIIGGCSSVSGGNYGSYGTDVQAKAAEKDPEHFANDSADLYYREKLLLGGYWNDPELVRVWADEALAGYEWLKGLGVTWATVRMYDGLHQLQPENPQGMYLHGIWNTPFVNGEWIGPFTKGRHHRNGTYKEFVNGAANIAAMADAAQARGIQILTEMQVMEIIRENMLSGDVLGVKVANLASGDIIAVRARKAVILAAGGFTANAELCKRYDPRLSLKVSSGGVAAPGSPGRGCTGDVLMAAMDIGADATQLNLTQLRMQRSVVAYTGPDSTVLAADDGQYIDVDQEGNRFWRETEQTTFRNAQLTVLHERGMHMWWGISDAEGVGDNTAAIEHALEVGGAFRAETLEELAQIIQVPAANLVATVNRYHQFVDQGVDEDFGQFRAYLNKKFLTPPFYAIPKTYYRHHSLGGVRINPKAQVLDRRNQVIPRLYAAGEFTGGVHGHERDGGCGWTDIIVFGRIAGRNGAAETPR